MKPNPYPTGTPESQRYHGHRMAYEELEKLRLALIKNHRRDEANVVAALQEDIARKALP